jgi:hypothetical protein
MTSPEVAFVNLCVSEPETISSGAIASAARDIRSWNRVVELAIRHRVAAYLLRSAARAGVNLPSPAREQLESEALASQAVALLLESELERIVAALAAHDIPVLVLKGPALERTLYAEKGLRPYSDLDLTVHDRDGAKSAAVLERLGYAELIYEAEAARMAHAGHLHESGSFHRLFAGAGDRALVELHLDSLQLGIDPACEEGRWQRAEPVPGLAGACMLGPEDQVVQLSVHAHKHGFSRLIWLKDLDLLLRKQGRALQWQLVAEVARREGVGGSVWYTLTLTHALLGTPFQPDIAALRPSTMTRWLYSVVWPARRILRLEGYLRRRAIQFHVADSWRGMLPSLLLLGRKRVRVRLMLATLLGKYGHA